MMSFPATRSSVEEAAMGRLLTAAAQREQKALTLDWVKHFSSGQCHCFDEAKAGGPIVA
jgi:hypothetical protein